MFKIIKGHLYTCAYQGVIVFYIDGVAYYSMFDAADALGMTIEEFKEVW